MCDGIGAVSFAAFDVYPDIDRGWWCLVERFVVRDGAWHPAGGLYDNTARLTVTTNGATRDVRITPWNGAYVVVAAGLNSTLTGYNADGNVLGTVTTTNRPAPAYDESRAITIPFDPENPPAGETITYTLREPT